MPEIYCVRAKYGLYADDFLKGRYVAIGWFDNLDLSILKDREAVQDVYQTHHQTDTSPYVIGQQVGQITRFLFDIKPGDFVITPSSDTEYVYWGILKNEPYYFENYPTDRCPYKHRRKVDWHPNPIQRSQFSVPLQNTIRSSLTVFFVGHKESFFKAIGKPELISSKELKYQESTADLVLNRILELDANEFEILVTELLSALGFEAEHLGKVGNGGVDAKGELDLYNLAKIKLFVQAKRYKIGSTISANQVKALRQNIPASAQGAFITTADFQKKALEIATEQGFPRIGTVNGEQLVDLISEKWEQLSQEMRNKLGLKRGLIAK